MSLGQKEYEIRRKNTILSCSCVGKFKTKAMTNSPLGASVVQSRLRHRPLDLVAIATYVQLAHCLLHVPSS
jgi:hypothetical protein